MKIALLNLPVDNNYGGHLQRYALMKILQDMGHDVTHIFLKVHYSLPWYKYPYSYTKRFVNKFLFRKSISIRQEYYRNQEYESSLSATLPFYNRYIKHTKTCYNIKDIIKETKGKFDAYIVGSDQVWRKDMTGQIGLDNFFLEFADEGKKRIAYSVSLGSDKLVCTEDEIQSLGKLYRGFSAVSVRELGSLGVFDEAGWTEPKAKLTLDPVLLLEKNVYIDIIKENKCHHDTEGKCFCYILDYNENVEKEIKRIEEETDSERYIQILADKVSVPQWMANFYYADNIVTDSYHGVVLSIMFCKSFFFLGNNRRGNTRIDSLFKMLGVNNTSNLNWEEVYDNISKIKGKSLNMLRSI